MKIMECHAAAKNHVLYYFSVGLSVKLKSMSAGILPFQFLLHSWYPKAVHTVGK